MLPTLKMCKAGDFPDEEKNKYLHSSRLIIVSNLELYNINSKLNNADRNRIPVTVLPRVYTSVSYDNIG